MDDKEDDWHQEGRQDIKGLDITEFEQGDPGGGDQETADDGDLGNQRSGEKTGREVLGDQVDGPLPAEEDWSTEQHPPAETGAEDHRGHKVEGGVGIEHRLITTDRCHHWTDDREGADAAEEDPGGQPLDQLGVATEALDQVVEPPVEVPPGAE